MELAIREEWPIEHVSVEEIEKHPDNPRRHPDKQVAALTESMKEHGNVGTPIWNRRTGRLIDGHARLDLLLNAGAQSVRCLVVDMPVEQERRLLVQFDKIGDLAEYDDEVLRKMLIEFNKSEQGLPAGWDEDDIPRLTLRSFDDGLPVSDDNLPNGSMELPGRTKPGELWQLGDHRLLVGEGGHPESVNVLLDGVKADLVFADLYQSRFVTPEEFLLDMDRVFRADYLSLFVWVPDAILGMVFNWAEENLTWSRVLVWERDNAEAEQSDYMQDTDFLVYIGKGSKFNGADVEPTANRKKVLHYDLAENEVPGTKPIDLIANQILLTTAPGNIVVDPFAGQGNVLLACVRTERICYCLEKDPKMADLLIARYEAATRAKARKV